jgi:hypothetical protein
LDELTSLNKSIWLQYFAVLRVRNKDTRLMKNWKVGIWTNWMSIRSLSYVSRYYHWHLYWITIGYISFCRIDREKRNEKQNRYFMHTCMFFGCMLVISPTNKLFVTFPALFMA